MIYKLKFYHSKENEMYEVNGLRISQKTIECFPKDNRFSFITFEEDEGILIQSTGLKDVNSIEVFENDIARVHEFINIGVDVYEEGEKETIGIIKYGCLYDSPIPEWYLQTKDDCISFSYMDLHEESFEVLGNQFEHPHLLKEW